jgi:hypothetical protein
MSNPLGHIKPYTPVRSLDRSKFDSCNQQFRVEEVAPVVGMALTFIRKVVGKELTLTANHVLELMDQDEFFETFVPRSRILEYLERTKSNPVRQNPIVTE